MSDARLRRLEERLERLERQQEARGRVANPFPDLQVRVAKIVTPLPAATADVGDDELAVWKIRFVDATFNEGGTGIAPEVDERGETGFFAAAPLELKLREDALVVVARVNDRWWILNAYAPWTLFRLGKADAAIAKGATGTVSLYDGQYGDEADTDEDVDGVLARYSDVPAGAWTLLAPTANGYEIAEFECDPPEE